MNEKNNTTASTPAAPVKDFEQVKRDFETALDSGKDYGPALLDLSTVFAYSVVNKCIDPQVYMNIVFWLLIVIALVLLWFCLSFAFKGIGGVGLKLFNDAKKEIEGDKPEKF